MQETAAEPPVRCFIVKTVVTVWVNILARTPEEAVQYTRDSIQEFAESDRAAIDNWLEAKPDAEGRGLYAGLQIGEPIENAPYAIDSEESADEDDAAEYEAFIAAT